MLILHIIGIVMGMGTGFAHTFLGKSMAKMKPDEAMKLSIQTLALTKMGNIGIILAVFSGFYLIIPYWSSLSENPLLILKLLLVITLAVLITMINVFSTKVIKGEAEIYLKKIEKLGKICMIIDLSIIILAVSVFH